MRANRDRSRQRSGRSVLMVGAFPKDRDVGFAGGQLTMAKEMMRSSIPERFDIVTLDSTQRTVPAPSLLVRALLGLGRFTKFVGMVGHRKIGAVVVVTADGTSLIEKSLMLGVARLFRCGTASWPVADLVPKARTSGFWRWWTRRLVLWSDVVICQGNSVAVRFEEFLGAATDQCVVVPNFVDLSFWKPPSPPVERKLEGVFAGWISREKGVLDLIDAIAESPALRRRRLYLCGGGPEEAEVADAIRKRSLGDCIVPMGWIGREELRDLLQASEIFVLPSHLEGFPMSVIEAMAAGAVVVTTPVGSIPDYLEHEANALLVEPRSSRELGRALERVFDDGSLRNSLRVEGRRLVDTTFSLERASTELGNVLTRILSKSRRAR